MKKINTAFGGITGSSGKPETKVHRPEGLYQEYEAFKKLGIVPRREN